MSELTPAQAAKKAEVEAAGGTFVHPSQYKEMMKGRKSTKKGGKGYKTGYKGGAAILKGQPGAVAMVSARAKYPKMFRELAPDTARLVEQMLNPDGTVEATRWPNTYGLSAIYKCNTIINPAFSANNKCCVVVNPTVRDSIFYTYGQPTSVTLTPYGSIEDNPTWDPNPFSSQNYDLSNGTDGAWWSSPIILPSREALLPLPSSQAAALVYPIGFTETSASTEAINLVMIFDGALSRQAVVTAVLYNNTYDALRTVSASIGSIGGAAPEAAPTSIGVILDLLPAISGYIEEIQYMSIYINGTDIPYYGTVQMYIQQNSQETQSQLVAPNHEQHVVIQDIKDADTIDGSADQAFVLSQSTLITSNFSDLQNGGVIAIARIPGAAVVGGGDIGVDANSWYDWISSLSYNQYDGAVKHGAYSWYLPEDETGFFYRPISSYAAKQLPYVVSEFSTTDTDSTALGIRLKVTTIVQFTTTSSVYDCRPSSRIEEALFMHMVLSLVRASYSNGGHIAGLKQSLKNIGNNVIKLLKNPKTYSTAAELIGGLASA